MHVEIHENQGPWFERNYILDKEQKSDDQGASFESLPKVNCMLNTRLICIQWKFTTPNQWASPSKFYIKILLFSATEVVTCSRVIKDFKQ